MNKELIISIDSSEINLALLEDKSLVELHKEKTSNKFSVGDIYLGKVKKLMPGLNAAFVNVGHEKDAFLHYLDLGPQVKSLMKFTKMASAGTQFTISSPLFEVEPDIEKTGKIVDVLNVNQQVIIQIVKEPIAAKGPRISSEISFAGRFLVLVPFSDRISVSQKIKSGEERNRLKRQVKAVLPKNFGVIIRTAAEGKSVAEIDADLKGLLAKWDGLASRVISSKAPAKIVSEIDRTSALLRDLLNDTFNNIYVDDANYYEEIRGYIQTIAPDQVGIVKHYKGTLNIFEHFGIDKQIKNSFGKIVSIKSGVYLIIEHTEAMHVIDINSGHRMNKDKNQEGNSLETNLEAAAEVARQLRLRDLGGIIVVDFIDMTDPQHRKLLFQKLREEMEKDHAKHTILPPSKFGLVQITRQRVRPEMNIKIQEKCPVCNGSGEIKPSIILIDEIENNLRYLIQEQNEKYLKVSVHPFVNSFIKHGLHSLQIKWYFKYKKWIRVKPNNSHHFLEYHFFNKQNDEIKI